MSINWIKSDRQLKNRLRLFTLADLQNTAESLGLESGGTKDTLISKIFAHLTKAITYIKEKTRKEDGSEYQSTCKELKDLYNNSVNINKPTSINKSTNNWASMGKEQLKNEALRRGLNNTGVRANLIDRIEEDERNKARREPLDAGLLENPTDSVDELRLKIRNFIQATRKHAEEQIALLESLVGSL